MAKQTTWYAWQSPIGLGLFLIGLALAFYVFSLGVMTFAKTGTIGLDVAEQSLRLEQMVAE